VADRVAVLSPEGQFGTVDSADVEAVTRAGGKVLTPAEVKGRETQEAYDKQSTATKIATVASMAGPIAYPLHAYLRGQGAVLPPELEAYTQGVSQGFTGGAASVGMKELVGAVGGDKAAHAYGQTAADTVTAHEGLHTAGELAGFLGGATAGGAKAGLGAAGKVIPGVAIGAAGGLAERGAARVLAPIAARGAIGRALATGGELAARGATEGGLYSAAGSVTEDMLGDRDVATDKLWAATGTGALYGGLGGAALGTTGSLVASGARGAASLTRSGISRALATSADVAKASEGLAAVGDIAKQEIRGAAGDVVSGARQAIDETAISARKAVSETANDALQSGKGIAEATGTDAAQEAGAYRSAIDNASKTATQKGWAYEQAWKAAGAGQGLQSTTFAKSAERYLPNGTKDVGEVMLRHGIISVDDGILNAARAGTPEAMVPKFEAAQAAVGSQLGDITAASPARISAKSIESAIDDVASKYEASAATRPIGKSIRTFAAELRDSLGISDLTSRELNVPAGGRFKFDPNAGIKGAFKTEPAFAIGDAPRDIGLRPNLFASSRAAAVETSARRPISLARDLAFDADAGLKPAAMRAGEETADVFRLGKAGASPVSMLEGEAGALGGKSPISIESHASVPLQDLLRERKALDNMVFENAALDPSVTIQVKRELRSKLEGLIMDGLDEAGGKLPGEVKAQYKALKHDYTALSIGLDAAEDSAARMKKAATFGLTDTLRGGGSIVKTIGSKLVRERGNAAAAVLLYRMADMGSLTRAIGSVDEAVGRAAKGLLSAPTARPLPEAASTEPLRVRAARIMDRVAAIQANPDQYAARVAEHTSAISTNAPNLASGLTQKLVSAAAFMASKMPVHEDRDPFDLHPAPHLTDAQASAIIRYDAYVEKPMRFFDEVSHGKITHEGVEVARALMPGAFAELQQRTVEGLADLIAQGKKPPYAQRERLGILLDIPATPAQRPDHMRLLQANVAAPSAQGKQAQPTPPKRPYVAKSQPSALDRLEGR
jgi:hypothetical protein